MTWLKAQAVCCEAGRAMTVLASSKVSSPSTPASHTVPKASPAHLIWQIHRHIQDASQLVAHGGGNLTNLRGRVVKERALARELCQPRRAPFDRVHRFSKAQRVLAECRFGRPRSSDGCARAELDLLVGDLEEFGRAVARHFVRRKAKA